MRYYMKYNYKRALKVIDSCETLVHLRGARNYVNNFFKYYSSQTGEKVGPFSIVEVDKVVATTYSRLLTALEIKEKSIKKSW